LLNRRLSSVSYLAHLYYIAPGLAGLFDVNQTVDSDHESRLLKNSRLDA